MEIQQYAELVERVRKAQNQYFKTKATIDLENSKKIERILDQQTELILGPDRIVNQKSLF